MREPTKAAIAHGRRMPTSSLCVLRKIKRCERIQSLGRPTEVCGSPTLGVPDSIEVARLSPEMGGIRDASGAGAVAAQIKYAVRLAIHGLLVSRVAAVENPNRRAGQTEPARLRILEFVRAKSIAYGIVKLFALTESSRPNRVQSKAAARSFDVGCVNLSHPGKAVVAADHTRKIRSFEASPRTLTRS